MPTCRDFDLKTNQCFLFDTNIWMLLFCPIGNYREKKQQVVSKFFERLLSTPNTQIIITSAIVSEFANAFLRLDFKLWKEEEQQYRSDFKRDFFGSQRCQDTRATIAHILQSKIFPFCERYPDSFNAIDMEAIFQLYKFVDYNDALFYYMCKSKEWIFVSDDTDFDSLGGVITIRP